MSLNKNPSYRRPINKSQLHVLMCLFKYRFVGVPLLSQYLGKDRSTIYERLMVLENHGLVYKAYDSTYRLPAKPAVYSLTKQGIKFLRINKPDIEKSSIRYIYRINPDNSEAVDHALRLLELHLQLQAQYPDTFDIFSKSEMAGYKMFVRPLPDLYLKRRSKRSRQPDYLIDFIPAGAFSHILNRRLRQHTDYSDDYADYYGSKGYPILLIICGNDSTERRVQNMALNMFFIDVYTTTQERLESGETKIWLYEHFDDDPMVFREL